jgi:hypothetical protein
MAKKPDRTTPPEGKVWICTKYITVRGKKIYAASHGLKAFCFWATPKKA